MFPPSPLGRVRGEGTTVSEARPIDHQGLLVFVLEWLPDAGPEGHLVFSLDRLLRPWRVEVSVRYRQMHDALSRRDASRGPCMSANSFACSSGMGSGSSSKGRSKGHNKRFTSTAADPAS